MMDDLIQVLKNFQQNVHQLIVMLDANKNLQQNTAASVTAQIMQLGLRNSIVDHHEIDQNIQPITEGVI